PLSNPENKAVVDFILAHENIGGILTHHTSGGVILYPPGTKASYKSEFFDMKMYQNIGKMAKEEMGYPTVNIFDCFMIDQENYSSGCLDDWAYQTQGIYAYTVELWDLKSKIGKPVDWNKRMPFEVENELDTFAKVIKWCEENHVDAFKEWTPVVHPQLGDIEIGGFDQKFVYQNPPKQMLLTEVEHATNFTLRFIKTMPKLVIDFVKTTKVSDDVYEITAQVSNAGYLPTYLSKEAINLNVHKNVKVTLTCAGTVLNGDNTVDLGGLNGFGGVKTGIGFGGNIDTYASEPISKQVTWLVKGNPNTITVTASSPKTGTTVKTC
ncbi:MAG: zinc carboxypeptidase, partial [Erysipelotrichaceae bacterium]|nr:zinc carboxypeptidase [Erysipelotrichaceae bacterium]